MALPEYLGQAVLDVAVVPGRVAYLIREGSRDGFRRAVQETCTRWGGQTEPIIPVSAGETPAGWWQQVVQIAGVEAVVNVDVPDADAVAFADALGLVQVPLGHIDQWPSPSSFTVHPSCVGGMPKPTQAYVLAAEDAPLWQVTVAGDLTADHEATLNPNPPPFRQSSTFPIHRVQAEDQIARAQLGGVTLLDRTVTQFGECWASGGPSSFPALVWVTDDDSLDDCLWLWNLRALRPLRFETVPMVLLPFGAVENWLGYAEQLASLLRRLEGFSPDVVIGSHTVGEDRLHQFATELGLQPSREEVHSGRSYGTARPREAPFTYLTQAELGRPTSTIDCG
jgi:hypothetical protein